MLKTTSALVSLCLMFGASADAGTQTQTKGLITQASADGFQLAGARIYYSRDTQFVFGYAALLSIGTPVHVEGVANDHGGIDATKITFSGNSVRIEGIIERVATNQNTFMILGIVIEPLSNANSKDSLNGRTTLHLRDLKVGDYVAVRGESKNGRIVANQIERDSASETLLQGPASKFNENAQTLNILGVAIRTSSTTHYEGLNGQPITAANFFSAVQDRHSSITAQWAESITDSSIAVKELSIED